MPFNYPDVLASVGSTVLDETKTYYTEEYKFLMGARNVFTCMGGPNWNPGTTKILNSIFDTYGARETARFLYCADKISTVYFERNINYAYFWDLFKACRENLEEFKRAVESQAALIDTSVIASVLPQSFREAFE